MKKVPRHVVFPLFRSLYHTHMSFFFPESRRLQCFSMPTRSHTIARSGYSNGTERLPIRIAAGKAITLSGKNGRNGDGRRTNTERTRTTTGKSGNGKNRKKRQNTKPKSAAEETDNLDEIRAPQPPDDVARDTRDWRRRRRRRWQRPKTESNVVRGCGWRVRRPSAVPARPHTGAAIWCLGLAAVRSTGAAIVGPSHRPFTNNFSRRWAESIRVTRDYSDRFHRRRPSSGTAVADDRSKASAADGANVTQPKPRGPSKRSWNIREISSAIYFENIENCAKS